ncbi:MAG: MBOAT family protein [Leptospira sp.]|nr:MBOAT family protein [Leptospira sp.]
MIKNDLINAIFSTFSVKIVDWNPILPEIMLPIGISFFTFQSMSYTIDVYRRVIPSEKSWIHYAFYISFFPQLVAGPIVKAREFLPQIRNFWDFSKIPLFAGMSWIALGAFKKVVLADRLAVLSDNFYAYPDAYSSAVAWVSVLSYSFQIFLDFSGYSDIAIGIALLLGFKLPLNFNLPYLAYSFSEFWRRWHISLSSWLRDYLYVSLGGNRVGRFLTYRNLFLVMLLGGLWHGASWNFLIWGGMHGIFLALERFIGLSKFLEKSGQVLRFPFRIFVFFSVTILWVFFRSPDFQISIDILEKIFSMSPGLNLGYSLKKEFFLVCSTLAIGHFLGKKGIHPLHWEDKNYRPVLHSLAFAIVFIIITLLAVPGKPFIYFVF